ncbi:MAG: S8 family serine peptidase [Solirubrobacteraceae bacterium]
MRRTLPFALLAFALLLPQGAVADTRIIVKREPGLSPAERKDIRADAGVRLLERLPLARTEVVTARNGSEALRELRRDGDVVYAELDRPVRALAADPGFSELWGLDKIFAGDVAAGWTLSTGVGRTVAVVDSGVDAAHPDLVGQVAAGWDWVEDDADPQDADGHGTHVAGTIAATRDNGEGIAGVAPDARLVPLRVLDGEGSGYTSDVVQAFGWAGESDVPVVNASLGGETFDETEYDVIARYPDTLFVVAAGNDGEDNDDPATREYPCGYGTDHPDHPDRPALENVVCVGASDESDARADFSNYGALAVDLFAPGVGILSTSLGEYYFGDGTSMATPHVAATAALLAARSPWLTVSEIKQAILDSADAVPTGARLDARGALDATFADPDGDGDLDPGDNCPSVYNPGQEDTDVNGTGDACEAGAPAVDRDGDAVLDADDDCPDEAWDGPDGCPLPAVTAADGDHDGVADASDPCPALTEPGGFGCPDADGDGVADDDDNCPSHVNGGQADADGDGVGDACDPTPRGPDADGDGKPLLDDHCPSQYGTDANGCPVTVTQPPPTSNPPPAPPPVWQPPADRDGDGRADPYDGCPAERAATADGCPLPVVESLRAKRSGRTVTIRIRADRAATMRVTVQRRKCKRKRCRWVRVTRKTLASESGRGKVKVRRARKGRYRAVVKLSSSAGTAKARRLRFRVR